MMQEILTYIIIASAFAAASYKIYLALPLNRKKASAGKCGTCATGCALKELKGESSCNTSDEVKIYL